MKHSNVAIVTPTQRIPFACTRAKVSDRLQGQFKRLFKADYTLCRECGLTRQQAFELCMKRYCRN